jgi:hypothetical protein
MITKSIVTKTIEMLEDYMDDMTAKVQFLANADRPEMDKQIAEAQSLLNFWRLYSNFLPEEDDVC